MPKYLQIQIPKACHENWDAMDPARQGKFCNTCQKNVVDFTLMTDTDLVNFFTKNTGNVCGKFSADQLNTDIPIPGKKIPWVKYFFQITLPAFLFSLKSNAQTNSLIGKVACVQSATPVKLGEVQAMRTREIKGKVIDDNGNPVPNATIIVKGTKMGTAADSAGNFSITLLYPIPPLVVSSIGFETREFNCTDSGFNNLTLQLPMRVLMGMVGEVVVTGKKKRSISIPFLNNRNIAVPTSFTIFPNPLPPSSKLTIKWKEAVVSDQLLEIFDPAGNLLQQELVKTNKKLSQQSVVLKAFPSGYYVVKITDSKTHSSSSRQFVVE